MNDSLSNRVMKVKVQSFLIMILIYSVIHGLVPWWLFYSACYGILAWAFYGYKKVFKGWPAVTTLRQSGRAFILACAWPVTKPKRKEEAEAMNVLNTEVKKASRGVLVGGLIMAASFVALAYGLLGMLLR